MGELYDYCSGINTTSTCVVIASWSTTNAPKDPAVMAVVADRVITSPVDAEVEIGIAVDPRPAWEWTADAEVDPRPVATDNSIATVPHEVGEKT